MGSLSLRVAVLIVVTLFVKSNGEIPSFIKVCKSTDPDLSGCIKESVYQLLPRLAKGIPELGVPVLEPFDVGTLEVTSNLNLNLTNLKLHGFVVNPVIEELSANFEKYQFAMVLHFTNIHFTADYAINTKLLSIPLQGHGPATGNVGSLHFLGKLKGRPVDQNGKTHLRLNFSEFKIAQPKDVKMNLENLFPDNKQLAEAASKVVEDSSDVLFEELITFLEAKLKMQVTQLSNQIVEKYSVDELFPSK